MINSVWEFRCDIVFKIFQDSSLDVIKLFILKISGFSGIKSDRSLLFAKLISSDIWGHDDDCVFEINPSSLAIFELSFIQDLEHNIQNIRRGLLNLIKENYRVWLSSHSLSKPSSFIISDISSRRSNQLWNWELLHKFRHIKSDHSSLITKIVLCNELCEVGFPNSRWSKEKKWTNRFIFFDHRKPTSNQSFYDIFYCIILPNDLFFKFSIESLELSNLIFIYNIGWNSGLVC